MLANSVIGYISVGCAGAINAYFMRRSEMERGIKIYDKDGREMGISKKCAKKAVYETAFSRVILPLPIYAVPGMTMFLLDKMRLIPKTRKG